MRPGASIVVRAGAALYALVAVVVPPMALLILGALVYWLAWLFG